MNMKRLGWFVAVVLVSVGAWAGSALAGPAKVYVADEGGDTVTVLDVAGPKVIATVPAGKGPNGISVTP